MVLHTSEGFLGTPLSGPTKERNDRKEGTGTLRVAHHPPEKLIGEQHPEHQPYKPNTNHEFGQPAVLMLNPHGCCANMHRTTTVHQSSTPQSYSPWMELETHVKLIVNQTVFFCHKHTLHLYPNPPTTCPPIYDFIMRS